MEDKDNQNKMMTTTTKWSERTIETDYDEPGLSVVYLKDQQEEEEESVCMC